MNQPNCESNIYTDSKTTLFQLYQIGENMTLPPELNFTFIKMLFNELQNMILNKNIRSLHDVVMAGFYNFI